MRLRILLALGIFLPAVSQAIPPVSGSYMVGADSTIHVVWFHPGVNSYEQGIDGDFQEIPVAPGDVPDKYAIAQRADFPSLSYILTFRAGIYPGDVTPSLPGDQFSPFGWSVYNNVNDLPEQPPILTGGGSLCGGQPCVEEWAEMDIGRFNPGGEALWFAMNWADSTPSAPQIRCVGIEDTKIFNKIGIMNGDSYEWNGLQFGAVYRYRILTAMKADSITDYGWRREEIGDSQPDSFYLQCFGPGKDGPMGFYAAPDTLLVVLPAQASDSVRIAACYGNIIEPDFLTLRFDGTRKGPVSGEIWPGKEGETSYFELILENSGPDSMALDLGYDDRLLVGEVREISLRGYEAATVPFQLLLDDRDSCEIIITVQDKEQRYYPFLMRQTYPFHGPTDIVENEEAVLPDVYGLRVYPNPGRDLFKISAPGLTRPVGAEIRNIMGQRVSELTIYPGTGTVWDGRDAFGAPAATGIYFVRIMESDCRARSLPVMLLR